MTFRLWSHLETVAVAQVDEKLAVMVYQRIARGADRSTAIWLVAAITDADYGTVERAIDGDPASRRAS